MRIMIASDIHGSAFYCRKMLDAFENEKVERLLLLGDLLYHGPRNDLPTEYAPKKVLQMLNEYKDNLLCVRGNCDCEVDQMVLDFPVLAEYAVLWTGSRMIYASHGHHLNPQTPPPLKQGDILLNGHTHIPKCENAGHFLYLNPGSVSIPKEKSPHGYLIWDDGKEELIQFRNLDGETWKTVTAPELDRLCPGK